MALFILIFIVGCEGLGNIPNLRIERRDWKIPIDRPVGSYTTRVTIEYPDEESKVKYQPSIQSGQTLEAYGYKDGSQYFTLVSAKEINLQKEFEVSLAKPLYGNLKVNDKLSLYIKVGILSIECFVTVEPPINPDFSPADLTTQRSVLPANISITRSTEELIETVTKDNEAQIDTDEEDAG